MRDLTISALLADYRSGHRQPRELLTALLQSIRAADEHNIWITVLDDTALEPYLAALEQADPAEFPLYGVPFAIKDNIDLAGVPTTAGCPDFAYIPEHSAFVVQRLIEAGAVPMGKTNLDQFATGLVGTRSPLGPGRNAFDPAYISGGSSSGSALAVSLGLASFALGTDTAGSGRVPAAFNNLIGVKPSCGLLSARGVVPACRSIDSVCLFAGTAADAAMVLAVAAVFDPEDAYARPDSVPAQGHASIPLSGFRFGVPRQEQLTFFGDEDAAALFRGAVSRLERLGGTPVEIDFQPFLDAARLLYEGPWVSERYAAIEDFMAQQPQALFPVTREIIGAGSTPSAVQAFNAGYQLKALKRQADLAWDSVDLIITPTAGTIYTIEAVNADPVALNSNLGYYTNFMNLLDYCALAVPAGFRPDGLPLGVTLFAPAFHDQDLLALGERLHLAAQLPLGASGRPPVQQPPVTVSHRHTIAVAVCGAHMRGLALNRQLTDRGARFLRTARSAPAYRFYALPGGPPHRPGMIKTGSDGGAIDMELWAVPADRFGHFVAEIPAPLGIGKVELEDGSEVCGFICEAIAGEGAEDITGLGSWRRYLERQGETQTESTV